MNFQTNINLLKLQAKVLTIGGEPCVCIPIERNDIFLSANEDGTPKSAYLSLSHWESRDNKYGDTHLVKQSHSKAYIEKRGINRNEPIIGNTRQLEVKPKESATVDAPAVAPAEEFDWNAEFPEALPFPPAE